MACVAARILVQKRDLLVPLADLFILGVEFRHFLVVGRFPLLLHGVNRARERHEAQAQHHLNHNQDFADESHPNVSKQSGLLMNVFSRNRFSRSHSVTITFPRQGPHTANFVFARVAD